MTELSFLSKFFIYILPASQQEGLIRCKGHYVK